MLEASADELTLDEAVKSYLFNSQIVTLPGGGMALILPGAFPAAARDMHGALPVYFESAAVITVLVLLGQVLELRARDRTSDAIRALLDLTRAR